MRRSQMAANSAHLTVYLGVLVGVGFSRSPWKQGAPHTRAKFDLEARFAFSLAHGYASRVLTAPLEVAQDVVLLDYAHAELLEPVRNEGAMQLAAQLERLGGFSRLTPQQQQVLIDGICQVREPMLGFLLRNKTTWFEASLSVDDLPNIHLTTWFERERYQSARTLHELLQTPGAADYVKPGFRLDAMRGRPIMVARDLDSSLCLIEGTSRCCEIVRLRRSGALEQASIMVFVGVCPNIHEYAPFHGGAALAGVKPWWVTTLDFLKGTLLTFARKTDEGQLVAAVGNAWLRILQFLATDPDAVMQMKPREWEEFIAGCYDRDGYVVTLTPPSGDLGRDVIAEKAGVGTIRILDQVKRYKPGHLVTYDEVRAMLFVAQADKATKSFITTTSAFAPRLMEDKLIAPHIKSGFLEPRDGEKTFAWLKELSRKAE